ncbi:coiled-coil domain-containing protein [Krasilnikoviella flava]|uniref:Uncharacterized protein n=1 Tax=Krasilnikoviella flava TaxID=526729 RepID=A0A1T5JK35_9MICO|nr:hypothetical protein [Krasilnikoviella flava]SKC51744.1 hypothetical protein SAMN04324258_1467 [Krasilnikoviella flava]
MSGADARPRTSSRWVRDHRTPIVLGTAAALLGAFATGATVVAADRDRDARTAQTQVTDTAAELDATRTELDGAVARAETAESRIDDAETEAATRQAELDERESGLDEREQDVAGREKAVSKTEKTIENNRIDEGVWTVGTDVEAGTYRTTEPVSGDCYWAIYRSGTNQDDIVQNDIVTGGRPTVALRDGQDFETNRCGTWDKQ